MKAVNSIRRVTPVFLILFFAQAAMTSVSAQEINDPVLFSVEGRPVHVSEFRYIYEKNNAKDADYSRESLEEYYDLYCNFKLKVQKARDLGMDEIPELQKELEGYRRQLADAYLVDRQVQENLIREAYDRSQKDVEIAHVLIKFPSQRTEKAELATRAKAEAAHNALKAGANWEKVIIEYSEDENSKAQSGYLGWFTAMMPAGFYELESAMYETEVGKFSAPVRSHLGYHIVYVQEKRKARGQVETAHILVKKQKDDRGVKLLVDSLHKQLENGADFGELAKKYSADKNSGRSGGRIGYVKIGQYEKNFEDAVFSLTRDESYTQPVLSTAGYHIIKRLSKIDLEDYPLAERRFKGQMAKDPRLVIAKKALLEEIRENSGYKENVPVISAYKVALADDFLSYQWKIPEVKERKVISFKKGKKYTTADLSNFLRSNIRDRIRLKDQVSPQQAFDELFVKFSDQMVAKYEESTLEDKYPEFRNLMREYSEGILLFEVTKENVWDRASTDTVGLTKYFRQNQDNYQWGQRARVHHVVIASDNEKIAKKVRKLSGKKDIKEVVSKYNAAENLVSYRIKLLPKEDLAEGLAYEYDAQSPLIQSENGKEYSFWQLDAPLPASPKSLKESRGFVIADYQTVLEEKWLIDLHETYKVVRDEEVFSSLVK